MVTSGRYMKIYDAVDPREANPPLSVALYSRNCMSFVTCNGPFVTLWDACTGSVQCAAQRIIDDCLLFSVWYRSCHHHSFFLAQQRKLGFLVSSVLKACAIVLRTSRGDTGVAGRRQGGEAGSTYPPNVAPNIKSL